MLTATSDLLLPTTVTGSWPRPSWFDTNLHGRPFSTGMTDARYREQHIDAVSCVIADQELAGLDIVTNGDYHLDADLAGRSWFSYPLERLSGLTEHDTEQVEEWTYQPGTWLNEIMRGWRFPAVAGRLGPRVALEFGKIWRVAQARTRRPVKLGTIAADLAAAVLTLRTDAYPGDRRELMWDMATLLNGELRQLAAAGCRVIQVEEPYIHHKAAFGAPAEELDFLVDLFNHTVEGLEGVEVWVHTCWGNPGAQRVSNHLPYEPSLDIYLNRLKADVWTIESKDDDHAPLAAFAPYKGRLPKKVAVGFISHRRLQVEAPDEVAADVRRALRYIDVDRLVLSSDCGFGRQGMPRPVAFYKAAALVQGANIVRRELGLPESEARAADPALQLDVPAAATVAAG